MHTITISGYPLTEALTFTERQADTYTGAADDTHGWLLTQEQARQLVDAWSTAPGDSDVRRAYTYSPLGIFITALHMDGELVMDTWESAIGADGADLYSTLNMPFDFDITATPDSWQLDVTYRAGVSDTFTIDSTGKLPTPFRQDSLWFYSLLGFAWDRFSDSIDLTVEQAIAVPDLVIGKYPVFETTDGHETHSLGLATALRRN